MIDTSEKLHKFDGKKFLEYQNIISAIRQPMAVILPDFTYVLANKIYRIIFKKKIEQIIGLPMSEVLGQEAFENIKPQLEASLQGLNVQQDFCTTKLTLQRAIHWRFTFSPIFRHDKIIGVLLQGLNISDKINYERELKEKLSIIQKQNNEIQELNTQLEERNESLVVSNQKLEVSERKYRELFEESGIPMAQFSATGKLLLINKLGAKYFEKKPEELQGKPIGKLFKADAATILMKVLKKIKKSGKRQALEGELVSPKGQFWFSARFIPIFDENEQVSKIQVIGVDNTDKYHAESKLKKSEQQLKRAQEISLIGSFENIPETNEYHFSEQLLRIFGYSPGEKLSKNILLKHIVPEEREAYIKKINRLAKSKNTYKTEFEFAIYDTQKQRHDLFCLAEFERDSKGKLTKVVGILQDITETKKRKKRLQQTEQLYNKVVTLSPDAIIMADLEGKLRFINQQTRKYFRLSPEENISGSHIADWVYYKDLHKFKQNFAQLTGERKRPQDSQYRFKRKDGTMFWGEVNSSLIETSDNAPESVIGIIRDISQRKEHEQEILSAVIKAEDRERKRIAEDLHDGIGPMLSTVRIYNNMLLKDLPENKKQIIHKQSIELIDEAIKDTRAISNNLMPETLKKFGLQAATSLFCQKIANIGKIKVSYDYNFEDRLNENVETILYRIAKELITNTVKHAEADNISLKMLKRKDILRIMYSDDGIGFDTEEKAENQHGMGLKNIKTKLNTIGGEYQFKTAKGKGFSIKIVVKL